MDIGALDRDADLPGVTHRAFEHLGRDRQRIDIVEEMKTSYLDYAMSVIVSRALPDVRDGLKPVQRRILHTMWEQNLTADAKHRKCAKVVGDVMGNYHPHGDSAIYDALARMVQPWSLRVPLIDGQGNFGSMDPDPPASMRYTEARLARVANSLLDDLDKDTVDFTDNYDGSRKEPTVLPARFPNLLVNGAGGIAVGMATNIPPHNLGEVINATLATIDNPEITLDELMAMDGGYGGRIQVLDPRRPHEPLLDLLPAGTTFTGPALVELEANFSRFCRKTCWFGISVR
mgnify:CR=1 FL=1